MKSKSILMISVLFVILSVSLSAATVYVKPIASGDGGGDSWANASNDIQAAIYTYGATEVWIAAGIYYVNDADGFNPMNGVDVYGGFTGTENALGDRAKSDLNSDGTIDAWEFTNATILSADLDHSTSPDIYTGWPDNIGTSMDGNANHVIYQSANFANETIWGGLWIQGGNADGAGASDSLGAGLYTRENFKLQNSLMRYNQASHFGGGTYSYRGTVSYCRATHNIAKEGAGIYLRDNSSAEYCQADSNYAAEQGAGFSIYTVDAQATNCESFGNICDAIGSGYHIYRGSLSQSKSYSNIASGDGVGIYNNEGSVEDCDIYDNEMMSYGTGGGINSYKGTITKVRVYRNKSAAYGGGLYLRDASLSKSYIYDNETTRSDGDGGGLSIQGSSTVSNCVIYNNYAPDFGGGVYNNDADLINCTVVNNSSGDNGGGIYLRNAGAVVVNCAAWGNQTAASGDQMYQHLGNGNISYSASESSAQPGTGNIALSSGNNINTTSPYFVTPSTFIGLSGSSAQETELANADWDINVSSALKNAGTDTNAPTDDINENTRSTTDIGAYEQGAESATPICLDNFTAKLKDATVILKWTTASETENAGFNLYRNDELIAHISGAGTTTEANDYEFIDDEIIAGTYKYILADLSYAGNERVHDIVLSISIDENSLSPTSFSLSNAYPNPFNPSTTLGYSLQASADVKLTVFDLNGTIINAWNYSQQAPGWYEVTWNGRNTQGAELSSGIYLYTIQANDFVQTKKMILMK